MKLISQEIFYKTPKQGVVCGGDSGYTRPTGGEKMRRRTILTKSDSCDSFEYGFSADNGRTWSAMETTSVYEPLSDGGTVRRHIMPGWVDPKNGRLLTLSSFHAHEDREMGDILLHMSRWMTNDWTTDAQLYRIGV